MLYLPSEFQFAISTFSGFFRKRSWTKALLLLMGAVLCPGKRTVCNLLRTVGLSEDPNFHKYHRLLSQAKWSARKIGGALLELLIEQFCGSGGAPLVFGIDETIERRWGRKIKKRGIYRDPLRSIKSSIAKCSGLRWMSLMLLVELPWAVGLCWALPFLTVLCPSKGYYSTQPRSQKKLTDWAWQVILQLARWTTHLQRKVYLVGDGTYSTYELLGRCSGVEVDMIVRMRLDSRFFHFPTPPPPGQKGRKPIVGKRQLPLTQRVTDRRIKWTKFMFSQWYGRKQKCMELTSQIALWYKSGYPPVLVRWVLIRDPEGKLDPVAIACTDCELDPKQMVEFFVRRWRVEVTFAEVRRHLGVETQRQWSDLAIERSTPSLLALFSIVTLWANVLHKMGKLHIKSTAWYHKKHLTFSDAITAVRMHIYNPTNINTSTKNNEMLNLNQSYLFLWKIIASNIA